MYLNKEGAVIPTGAARSAEEWRSLVFLKWETKGGSTPAHKSSSGRHRTRPEQSAVASGALFRRAFARHDSIFFGYIITGIAVVPRLKPWASTLLQPIEAGVGRQASVLRFEGSS